MTDMGEPYAIVAALAELDPVDGDGVWCFFCERQQGSRSGHLPECLWLRAHSWIEEFRRLG